MDGFFIGLRKNKEKNSWFWNDGTLYEPTKRDVQFVDNDCVLLVDAHDNSWAKVGADCNKATIKYTVCEKIIFDGTLNVYDQYCGNNISPCSNNKKALKMM